MYGIYAVVITLPMITTILTHCESILVSLSSSSTATRTHSTAELIKFHRILYLRGFCLAYFMTLSRRFQVIELANQLSQWIHRGLSRHQTFSNKSSSSTVPLPSDLDFDLEKMRVHVIVKGNEGLRGGIGLMKEREGEREGDSVVDERDGVDEEEDDFGEEGPSVIVEKKVKEVVRLVDNPIRSYSLQSVTDHMTRLNNEDIYLIDRQRILKLLLTSSPIFEKFVLEVSKVSYWIIFDI